MNYNGQNFRRLPDDGNDGRGYDSTPGFFFVILPHRRSVKF